MNSNKTSHTIFIIFNKRSTVIKYLLLCDIVYTRKLLMNIMKKYMYTPAHFRALSTVLTASSSPHDLSTVFLDEDIDPLLKHLFSDEFCVPAYLQSS